MFYVVFFIIGLFFNSVLLGSNEMPDSLGNIRTAMSDSMKIGFYSSRSEVLENLKNILRDRASSYSGTSVSSLYAQWENNDTTRIFNQVSLNSNSIILEENFSYFIREKNDEDWMFLTGEFLLKNCSFGVRLGEVILNREYYKDGDEVEITYYIKKDSYIYFFSITTDGTAYLISDGISGAGVKRGSGRYKFPSELDRRRGIVLKARVLGRDESIERIFIIASSRRMESISAWSRENGLFIGDSEDLYRFISESRCGETDFKEILYIIRR